MRRKLLTSAAHLTLWWVSAEPAEHNLITLTDMNGQTGASMLQSALIKRKTKFIMSWKHIQNSPEVCLVSSEKTIWIFLFYPTFHLLDSLSSCSTRWKRGGHRITINNHSSRVIISLLLFWGRQGGNWSRRSSGFTVTCWAGILSTKPRRSTLQRAALFTSHPSFHPPAAPSICPYK